MGRMKVIKTHDVIAAALLALPPGQLKKLLTPEVQAVLEKYGKGAGADGAESVS